MIIADRGCEFLEITGSVITVDIGVIFSKLQKGRLKFLNSVSYGFKYLDLGFIIG